MNKILTIEQAVEVSKELRQQGKKIVLAGGCFDILHIGHIVFIERAKKAGGILILLLEHDDSIRKLKGPARPINTQDDRARILSALTDVDYIVKLSPLMTDKDYDDIVFDIKPDIIATSQGDSQKVHKIRQAAKTGGAVLEVTDFITDQSTSRLISLLGKEL